MLSSFLILVFIYPYTEDEDDTYAELCLSGEENELRGARNPECSPHKRTRTFSPLDLNPWYLTNIQCEGAESCILDDPVGPYVGPVYRGDENMYRYINRLVQPSDDTAVDVCKRIIIPNNDLDPYNPVVARMELDNCTSQYILHRANLPRIPADNQGELPDIIEGREEEFCQPLRMIPVLPIEQEYLPSAYYVEAWRKTMMNPAWLARLGLAPKEPFTAGMGVAFEETIEIRDDYSRVEINDLTEFQYERIYDPTHPFSPRWDFLYNERDHFSPMTVEYSGDPSNAVRCAGGPMAGSNIIKTDIMTWRLPAFEFYMTWRIAFNIICFNAQFVGIPCWEYFGATADDPPCPTKFWGPEKVELVLSRQMRQILCGPPHIEDLCEHITKPVAPANALKLRENNDENFPEGVPQGYTFEEYFEDHRPYMRCWDTGMECGRDYPPPYGEGVIDPYLFDGDAGMEYAVMGAGREGESCTIGGGNGVTASQVDMGADPIMDWMELKLYQLRGMRETGISCIVKHEKVFKVGNGEEIIANRAGGVYQKTTPDTKGNYNRYGTFPWPLQWRGYITDPEVELRYPNFGAGGAAPLRGNGLDDALMGQILVFDDEIVEGNGRLPYVAFVTETNNEITEGVEPHFVKAVAYNHGKFPDACANTEYWGQGEEYTMYKDTLPAYNQGLFEGVGEHTETCDDPMNSFCIEPLWGDVKRYFPKDDLRRD